MGKEPDYYQVLGIERDALPEEIRKAYLSLLKKFHPDINSGIGATEKIINIQKAYETLNDPGRRAAYDLNLPPIFITESIILDKKFSQTSLRAIDEPQLIYVMLDFINPQGSQSAKLIPIHLCFVIDASTSMKGGRMEMVKASALRLVKKLNQGDTVSIISFNDRADVILAATPVSEFPHIEQKIELLRPAGGTEIFSGLEAGIGQLQAFRPYQGPLVQHLVLFTDGHTYGDEAKCLEIVHKAKEGGINISIVGIGGEWNDEFLDQLAGIAGGNTFFVTSPKDIDSQLHRKILMLSSLHAQNITFEMSQNAEVEMRYAFRITPDTNPLPLSPSINLGNLYSGRNLSVLFEFLVPPIKSSGGKIDIAKGRLTGDLLLENKFINYSMTLSRIPSPVFKPGSPPAVLVEAMAKLTLYRLQEKARKEVREGKDEKAVSHLRSLATHLLSDGQSDLARAIIKEAEFISQSHSFSKDGDKRIKYGTKALLLPSGLESSI